MREAEFQAFFARYRERCDRFEVIRQEQQQMDQAQWLEAVQHGAHETFALYEQNQAELRWFWDTLDGKDGPLTDEEYNTLATELEKMYRSQRGDLFFMNETALRLLPHFEARGDAPRLMFLYSCEAFVNIEISRVQMPVYGARSMDYYRKIFKLLPQTLALQDPVMLRWIAVAYSNVLMVETATCAISMDAAWRYWEELKQLRDAPAVNAIPGAERSVQLMDHVIQRFSAESYAAYLDSTLPTSADVAKRIENMGELAYHKAASEPGGLKNGFANLMFNHVECGFRKGRFTADQAWRQLDTFVRQRRPLLNPETDDMLSFHVNYIRALMRLLPKTTLSRPEQERYQQEYRGIMEAFIRDYTRERSHIYMLNNVLWLVAFEPSFYTFMDTTEEKISFLYHMSVTRHVVTYLHSQMVARFGEAILSSVLAHRPELLIGFHGIQSAEEAVRRRDELLRFIWNAGLLHDIGKISMIDLIDTQLRPLFDEEFALIRTHPDKGGDLLDFDHDLACFSDIARGHHRFHNGQGGYPVSFDVSQSPDRIMIEIITLSDCLDAATDNMGRNYRRAKQVPQVLDEFARGAGTMYNPDLVRVMQEDTALQARLAELAGAERARVCQEARRDVAE